MNFEAVEVVIGRTTSRFKLKEGQYEFEDLVEDLAEAMKLIGAAKAYQEATIERTVVNNTIALPKGCEHVKKITPPVFYREVGSFLEVNAEEGTKIKIVYQTMPIDDRGYPLIPDSAEVREALIWYLAKNLILQGVIKTVNYQYAEAEWQWRCGSARAVLNVMSVAQWKKVADNYTSLGTNSSSVDPSVSFIFDREKNRL